MRMRCWSSDVCASDLLHISHSLADIQPSKSVSGTKLDKDTLDAIFINGRRAGSDMLEAVRFAERLFHFPQNVEHVAAVETGSLRVRGLGLTTCRQIAEQKDATEPNRQIGSGSCRERVRQDVRNSGLE